VIEKCDYYANADWARRAGAVDWARDAYLALHRPFRVHNMYDHPSWLERYAGPQPEQIVWMMEDLRRSDGTIALRDTADIERLLRSPRYRLGRWLLRSLDPLDRRARGVGRRLRRFGRRGLRFARRVAGSGRRRLLSR
jgi:hypothetical protein